MPPYKIDKVRMLQEADDPLLGMINFGPGRMLPFRDPKLTASTDIIRLKNLKDMVYKSWDEYLGNSINYSNPAKARISEVGELIAELTRKTEPYRKHIKNLGRNKKMKVLLETLGVK